MMVNTLRKHRLRICNISYQHNWNSLNPLTRAQAALFFLFFFAVFQMFMYGLRCLCLRGSSACVMSNAWHQLSPPESQTLKSFFSLQHMKMKIRSNTVADVAEAFFLCVLNLCWLPCMTGFCYSNKYLITRDSLILKRKKKARHTKRNSSGNSFAGFSVLGVWNMFMCGF